MKNWNLATLAADPSRLESVTPEALPELIGEAEALRARLWARLQAASITAPAAVAAEKPAADVLLTVDEAAARLGVNKRWMYRHAETLPFTRKLTEGTLRFSSRGLERWKESRR